MHILKKQLAKVGAIIVGSEQPHSKLGHQQN